MADAEINSDNVNEEVEAEVELDDQEIIALEGDAPEEDEMVDDVQPPSDNENDDVEKVSVFRN